MGFEYFFSNYNQWYYNCYHVCMFRYRFQKQIHFFFLSQKNRIFAQVCLYIPNRNESFLYNLIQYITLQTKT